jgi:RNA polymerase sigma-70 factor, ECF subfamily
MSEAYEQYQRYVKRTLRRLGVTAADADDAAQQVFMVVHRRLDEYRDVRTKRAWLFTISRLVSCNYHRGVRRARSHLHDFPPPPRTDLEDLFAHLEARRLLHDFVQALREKERAPFYLAHFEDFSAPEIAVRLGTNVNTIYARLRKARLLFERTLAGRG